MISDFFIPFSLPDSTINQKSIIKITLQVRICPGRRHALQLDRLHIITVGLDSSVCLDSEFGPVVADQWVLVNHVTALERGPSNAIQSLAFQMRFAVPGMR